MKYSGIVYDLDGVICSTDEFHYLAWKSIADDENIYFDREINNRLRGVSRMASLDIILEKATKDYSLNEKKVLCERKNEIYKKLLRQLSPSSVSNDTLVTIRILKRIGVRQSIGSSSKNTKFILDLIGLGDFFDAVVDGTMIANSKPDPEVFLKSAKAIGLSPEKCIVVEDADKGIDAGNAGGFFTCGIGPASGYPKTKYPIKRISDILNIVNP